MSDIITCPHCKNIIEVTEVMSAQLATTIRSELESEYSEKTRQLLTERASLSELQKHLEMREADLDERVTDAIAKERDLIVARARAEAQRLAAIEIKDRDDQLEVARTQLANFESQELDLRKKARELEERAAAQDLEIARRLDEERAKVRTAIESEFSEKKQRLANEQKALEALQQDLTAQKSMLDAQVKAAIDNERQQLLAKARLEAQQAVAVEIKDRDEQLIAAQSQLKAFESQELELRRKARELETRAEQQELEVTRKIDEERKVIRESAVKQAQEQNELKIAERDQTIEAMGKQLQDMQRKLEQGSQQIQGEVQELALEQLLTTLFPGDVIKAVSKGVNGGDVLHHVFDQNGKEAGLILWESKRTKHWQDQWLSKAIDDQQEAKASCTCIVTAAMPDGIEYFGESNSVWVTSWPCVTSAAFAMRRVLLETAQVRRAVDGQNGKMELVYNYLSGPEFRNRVRGLVEPYVEMQKDLEAERRAYTKHWNKRRKQLDRALASTTGLYGDLQGIIGSSLQEIEGMDILAIEGIAVTDEDLANSE